MKLMRSTTIAMFTMVALGASAQAQDARSNQDEIPYEFEFRYDREDLRTADSRRETLARLDDRADAYCDDQMREYRRACRDEIVREVRRGLDDVEEEDRRARQSRYALDD